MQTIFLCALRDDPFARVSKKLLNDSRLSFAAKGVLAYLVGKPKDWKLRVSDLVNHGSDGKAAIRTALNELRAAGYAEYVQPRKSGTFSEGVWKISDSPIFPPRTSFPDAVKWDTGNRHLSKIDCTENDGTKNKAKESPFTNGAVYSGTWKPDSRNASEQLAALRVPSDYPSQREFEAFIEATDFGQVANYRPGLYDDLCRNKWRVWNEESNNWHPIRDWRKFVAGLDEKISAAMPND